MSLSVQLWPVQLLTLQVTVQLEQENHVSIHQQWHMAGHGRRHRPHPSISEPSWDALSGHCIRPRSPDAKLWDLWGWA